MSFGISATAYQDELLWDTATGDPLGPLRELGSSSDAYLCDSDARRVTLRSTGFEEVSRRGTNRGR